MTPSDYLEFPLRAESGDGEPAGRVLLAVPYDIEIIESPEERERGWCTVITAVGTEYFLAMPAERVVARLNQARIASMQKLAQFQREMAAEAASRPNLVVPR